MKTKIFKILCLISSILFKVYPRKKYKFFDVIIVRSDAIGDFVLWMSAIACYQEKYKNKSILLICPNVDQPLAEATNAFVKILTFDRKLIIYDFFYYLKIMWKMSHLKSDVVINPTWQHHLSADQIVSVIKSSSKVGTKIKRDSRIEKLYDRFYTQLIEMPDLHEESELHAIEMFTRAILDKKYSYRLADLSCITNNYVSLINEDYCLISLSSSSVRKDWPIERVSNILNYIPAKFSIVLSGFGAKDRAKANYIISNDIKHKFYDYVDKTTVIDMICLISKAKFMLGNDSLGIHVAAACRVPSICFMHGGWFGRFVPYPNDVPEIDFHPHCVFQKLECFGCENCCSKDKNVNRPFYCLQQLNENKVINELDKMISSIC